MLTNVNNRGFSLIEATLYLAIVAILLTAVLNFHLVMGNTSSKLSSNIAVSRNRRVALSAIDYLVKNSDGFLRDISGDCSDFNSSPPVLALYFDDDTYLPGTCVENGGGVTLSIDGRRLSLICYPNIGINGLYKACDAATYPAGNSYYLTSPDVIILDDNLSFSTSTATTTTNYFTSLTTHLAVGVLSHDQIYLAAISTATSTMVMRNENPNGLIAWWKFDDVSGADAIDSIGNFDLTCDEEEPPITVDGLVDGSSGAFDFNSVDANYCYLEHIDDDFNLDKAFTIATWLDRDYDADVESTVIHKYDVSSNKGYQFYTTLTGQTVLTICDSTACTDIIDVADLLDDAVLYHVTVIYDLDNDIAKLYVYNPDAGTTSTTTASSLPILVNYNPLYSARIGYAMDGILDELRVYNRALTDEEVWALQSQGKY